MERALHKNRSLLAALSVAILLHGLLLTIPASRKAVIEALAPPAVTVRLMRPAVSAPPPRPAGQAAVRTRPEPAPRPEPPVRRAPTTTETPPAVVRSDEPERISASRILLDIEEKRKADPLAFMRPGDEKKPEFRQYQRPVLEDALNEPSLQLPFEDTRIYLVDSYDDGLLGGVERFFDEVTVPFGFTTRNNTRIQCAWVLIVAGCSWGDVSYYAARDKARKRR